MTSQLPSWATLPLDQSLAMKSAATRLAGEFDGIYGEETIERFLNTSFDQFATNATIPRFLPLMAERFARQRLRALSEGRRTTRRRKAHRALPVRPQRRPVADGPRLLPAPRWRGGRGVVWWLRARHRGQPRSGRGDGRTRHRYLRGVPQTVDRRNRPRGRRGRSPWVAETPARSFLASDTRSGFSTTPQERASTTCARSAMRSSDEFATCSNELNVPCRRRRWAFHDQYQP